MKKIIIAATTIAGLSAPAYAELEGDLSLTYSSQFNYRGVNDILQDATRNLGVGNVTDDTFEAALNLSWKLDDNWSLVGGVNINSISDASVDHDRFRFGVRYTTECYYVEVGYQRQELEFLPIANGFDTGEIYLKAGTEVLGVDVSLHVAHDVDLLEGTYVELSGRKDWAVSEQASIGLTVGVSYSFDYWENIIGTGSSLNHAYATLSFDYKATDNLTLSPFVTFSQGFNALEASGFGVSIEEDDELTFGLSASVSF